METKKKALQEKFLSLVRAISKNNPKIKYPLLRMILGRKTVKSSKEVYEIDDERQLNQAVRLAKFIADERAKLGKAVKGDDCIVYDSFLLHATKEELRLLWFLLKGKKGYEIAEILKLSLDEVIDLKKRLLAKGANVCSCFGAYRFSEKMVLEGEPQFLKDLERVYSQDYDTFVRRIEKISFTQDRRTAGMIAAIYQRHKLAEQLKANLPAYV